MDVCTFTDIVNFTQLSEKCESKIPLDLLSEYQSIMVLNITTIVVQLINLSVMPDINLGNTKNLYGNDRRTYF